MFVSSYSQTKDSAAIKESGKFLYTDVLYAGFTYDLDAASSQAGTWAISMGYRRMMNIYDKWGINLIASINSFYNGSP